MTKNDAHTYLLCEGHSVQKTWKDYISQIASATGIQHPTKIFDFCFQQSFSPNTPVTDSSTAICYPCWGQSSSRQACQSRNQMYYIHSVFEPNVLFLAHFRLHDDIKCWDNGAESCEAHTVIALNRNTNKMNNIKMNLLHVFFQNLLIIKDSNQIIYKNVLSKLLWQYKKLH
jgi:hypothetical protein